MGAMKTIILVRETGLMTGIHTREHSNRYQGWQLSLKHCKGILIFLCARCAGRESDTRRIELLVTF